MSACQLPASRHWRSSRPLKNNRNGTRRHGAWRPGRAGLSGRACVHALWQCRPISHQPARPRGLELNLTLRPAPEGNTSYFVTRSLQLSDKSRCAEGLKARTAPVATATDVLTITPSPVSPHLEQKRHSDLSR